MSERKDQIWLKKAKEREREIEGGGATANEESERGLRVRTRKGSKEEKGRQVPNSNTSVVFTSVLLTFGRDQRRMSK